MVDSVRNILKRKPPMPPPRKSLLDLMPLAEYVLIIVLSFILFLLSYAYLLYAVFSGYGGLQKRYQPGDSGTRAPNMNDGNMHVIMCGLTPFFVTNGVLVFRVWCCYNRQVAKVLHTLFFTVPIPLIIASFSYINDYFGYIGGEVPYLWTYHSWTGILFLILYFVQVISGLLIFEGLACYDRFDTMEIRARFVTYHNILGVIYFLLSVGLVISGVTEYAELPLLPPSGSKKSKYAEYTVFKFAEEQDDENLEPIMRRHYFTRHAASRTITILYVCSTIPVMYALAKEEFRYRGRIILTLDREKNFT